VAKINVTISDVDELTNVTMDVVRKKFNINSDSNEDDKLYTGIHNAIKDYINYEKKGKV